MIGSRIRALRTENGLTLKELGNMLNLGESTISMYENGRRNPDNNTILKLAKIFDVTTDYLLGREEKEVKPTTVAAHLPEGVELTEEEQKDIDDYIKFVISRRKE